MFVAAGEGGVFLAPACVAMENSSSSNDSNHRALTPITIVGQERRDGRKGPKIAELGKTDSDRPKLHFEKIRQGKPVDPANFCPSTLRSAMYDSALA